jgi:hypothetical protein
MKHLLEKTCRGCLNKSCQQHIHYHLVRPIGCKIFKFPKSKTMKTYIIINENDGNDSFTVEGNTSEEAAFAALKELGWGVTEGDEGEEENSMLP